METSNRNWLSFPGFVEKAASRFDDKEASKRYIKQKRVSKYVATTPRTDGRIDKIK